MGNLSEYVEKDSQTVTAIYEHYKQKGDSEGRRNYLGASIIGHHCDRYLWYNFRHADSPSFSGRMYRLFDTGDQEETRMVSDLRSIGCTVHDVDENGNQFRFVDVGGHFAGHMDGAGLGIPEAPKTWHVLEFKTHNKKSFLELKKKKVKIAKPQHYAQMQIYMHESGMKRALYMAKLKDTDALYTERVRYDKEYCEHLIERAELIIGMSEPPERPYSRPDYYLCSWCDAKDVCWGTGSTAVPVKSKSCRQCCHATPTMQGHAHWMCSKHERSLSFHDQEIACEDHLMLPGMIAFARPVGHGKDESGKDYIVFKNNVGSGDWYHGLGAGNKGFTSSELIVLSKSDLTNEMIIGTKEVMGAVATDVCNDILNRYPDSKVVWSGHREDLADEWKKRYDEDFWKAIPLDVSQLRDDRNVAEFDGGRLAVVYRNGYGAEIMEGNYLVL